MRLRVRGAILGRRRRRVRSVKKAAREPRVRLHVLLQTKSRTSRRQSMRYGRLWSREGVGALVALTLASAVLFMSFVLCARAVAFILGVRTLRAAPGDGPPGGTASVSRA